MQLFILGNYEETNKKLLPKSPDETYESSDIAIYNTCIKNQVYYASSIQYLMLILWQLTNPGNFGAKFLETSWQLGNLLCLVFFSTSRCEISVDRKAIKI